MQSAGSRVKRFKTMNIKLKSNKGKEKTRKSVTKKNGAKMAKRNDFIM